MKVLLISALGLAIGIVYKHSEGAALSMPIRASGLSRWKDLTGQASR